MELLPSGSYRCIPEQKVFGSREVFGAPHDTESPTLVRDDEATAVEPATSTCDFKCPTCGSSDLERLANGSYRCRTEDKIFGANEVENPPRRPPPPARPDWRVFVSTTFEIPGYEIVEYRSDVFGIVVRSRNYISNLGAGAKALVGGELRGLTKLIQETRSACLERLRDEARVHQANAVVGLRFDSSEYGDYATELIAYGTAVTVRPRQQQGTHAMSDRTGVDAGPGSSDGARSDSGVD